MGERLRAITFNTRAATALEFPDATIPLGPRDMVVLAAPPWMAQSLVPQLTVPTEFRAIVNAHFKMPAPPNLPTQKDAPPILGVIGGTAEWIFSFSDRISVTVSGADAIVDRDREDLAQTLWADVCAALKISAELPKWQIVKEKRATFAATPWKTPSGPPLAQPGAISFWPATGPGPACPPPLKGPSGRAKRRRLWRCANCLYSRAMNQLAPGDFIGVEGAIRAATDAILAQQRPDGHWVYELEADATIPAEYVLLVHYLAETPNLELERKIGVYLRRIQGAHGGWPLYHEGVFDISATVKAYFALKMIGDDIEAPHMVRAREAIRARGGAIKANVFTRILLCLYGECSWNDVPTVPPELILLPRWFPIHLSKMSYWARTVIVPLLVLCAKKPLARNPRGIHVPELFVAGMGAASPRAPHQSAGWSAFFAALDRVLKVVPWPKGARARAIEKCRAWTTERLNGEDGLGAIYPAMANSVMMYDVLGYPPDHPTRAIARKSVENLLVIKEHEAYCQPCVSPVWDTALVAHALLETRDPKAEAAVARGLEWLAPLQVLDVKGDWAEERPNVRPGGWAFQYRNDYYPDLDDTAVVVMAMDRARKSHITSANYDTAIARGTEWVDGLQSRGGGWGAFDADNSYYYLNNIPFADHGALLTRPPKMFRAAVSACGRSWA